MEHGCRGVAATEALGQALDLIVPKPQRQRHFAGSGAVIESALGGTRELRECLDESFGSSRLIKFIACSRCRRARYEWRGASRWNQLWGW